MGAVAVNEARSCGKCAYCGQVRMLEPDETAEKILRLSQTAAVQEWCALVVLLGIGRDPDEWKRLLERVHFMEAIARGGQSEREGGGGDGAPRGGTEGGG